MIRQAIVKVAQGEDLSEQEMAAAMEEIMNGEATPAQIAAFLAALKMKGETVEEITASARVLRSRSTPIPRQTRGDHHPPMDGDGMEVLVDTCGTGGDGARTFNVSTTAAFVVAGAGLKVAKHGNRAVSSRCGSADLLEALGVPLDLPPVYVAMCIERVGIGFLFAPVFHRAMHHVSGPRREIGLVTIFNLLGPLTNPAGATVQVLGVYHPELTVKIAEVLKRLGCRSALVVHGEGGLDELSILGTSWIARLHEGRITTFRLTPEDVGFRRATLEEIRGGSADENAAITMAVLRGDRGAPRDMVLLNAAAALLGAGVAATLQEGIKMAEESIDSGKALRKLQDLVSFCREANDETLTI